jgi:ferric-dicitrate binding protein FerR (iron transport regulator)
MRRKRPLVWVSGCMLSLCLTLPTGRLGGQQAGGQRAGEVSRVVPVVRITRGVNSLNALEKTVVNWQDLINTEANARARVSLDDGSLLNVGSQSTLRVLKHDSGAQQTYLELGFGKMRTQAKKITKPTGKFEVRTPAGVAGVVGTDFYVGYENDVMTVIAFDGVVRVCNLAGVCVEVGASQITTVRTQDTSGPAAPALATQRILTDAANSTNADVNPSLGVVARAVSAHIGNTNVSDGTTVYSGDFLSTQPGGTLLVRMGALSLELPGNSSAHLYRASYGVVVELNSGTARYATPGGQQSLVIVASDVRVTPAAATAGLGRVSIDGPCKLIVSNQRGQVAVQAGSETMIVEPGKAIRVIPANSVSYQDYRSPDADEYHNFHQHTSCAVPQTSSGRGPNVAGRSHFLYIAVGTTAIMTIIPVIEALESPDRP